MKKQLLKKSLLSVLALALFTTTSNAQAPTPDLLHYKFDGAGTSVTNYASAPPVGTTTGTIMGTQTQTGVIGCMPALVGTGLSSTNDYVNTGWTPNLTGSWSISFWSSNIQPSTTLYYIFGDVNSSSFRCFTNGVAGANNWILRGGFTDVLITGAATTASNMVTFVYDQTAGNITGYVNGAPTVTVAQTAAPLNGTGPFKVGGYSSSTGLSPLGLMGDFRIYSSALTPAQVLALYNATNPVTPTLSVLGTNTICAGNSAVLTGSGAVTYTWSTGSNSFSINTTPSVTTTYTLMGANTTCSATPVTFTVNVNALPTVSLTASMYTTCVNAGTISLTGSPAGGVYTGTNVAGNVFTPGTNAGTYTAVYSYTDSSTGCTNSTSTNIVVDLCTGITNYLAETNGIQITPNPNAGNFTIEFRNESEKSIEIVNILGQSVKTVTTSEKAVRFDINNLPSGTYYAIIKMNNNVTTTKLIKQ
ncbi:MAG: T9SS type A sorting domain-containing protein [Bacteroidia bacterium]|nr:T9SS type A sorting domain-containing protein [Bacteroidia bacterium]